MKIGFSAVLLMVGPAASASAEFRVATTIGPLHSLASMVTEGVVEPDMLIQPGASPHYYTMTPSQTTALAEADVVFAVGDGLELWLERPLATLAPDADIVMLGSVPGVTRLPVREAGLWHAHGGHTGEGVDPHFWLSPDNAAVWLDAIAQALASVDPENASIYQANAATASARLDAVEKRIDSLLDDTRGHPYIVFHDAYQYFEESFDLHPAGAVMMDDARKPGAARIKQLRDKLVELGARCIFVEPQFSPAIVHMLVEDTDVDVAVLDPIGADLSPGPDLYPQLLENLAAALVGCLEGSSG